MEEHTENLKENAVIDKKKLLETKTYTEAEALQDEDIWLVSEGDEEYDCNARNVDFYSNYDNLS